MKTSARSIDTIVLDERCQARVQLDPDAVRDYAELLRADVELPPIDVVEVEGKLLLIDGFHRLAAARKADMATIRVRVVERCDDIDRAIWLASAANQTHGLRRSREDKRQAVRLALDAYGADFSNREIARHVGVSDPFVGTIRKQWEGQLRGDDGGASANVSTQDIADDAQGLSEVDTERPDTSTAEPGPIERAAAVERIAKAALRAAEQAHRGVERIASGALAELAGDVLEAALVFHEQAQAAVREARGRG